MLNLHHTETRMATNMDMDLEVIFKEKVEEEEIKGEGATEDNTIRFDFRALTPATPPPGRGTEARTGDGEEHRRVEGKVDFEGWVNQFEEYATLGQWNGEERASLLFLSLPGGARMFFVGQPERENMIYLARV